MPQNTIGIIMNGASGRMGYRQHLVRSILAIREQGGVLLPDGRRVQVQPLLVGRSEAKLRELAAQHDIADYTTDLDAALADPRWEIYADFLVTKARAAASTSLNLIFMPALVGSQKKPTRAPFGNISLTSSNRFPSNSGAKVVNPVMFPPGRARLSTSPAATA